MNLFSIITVAVLFVIVMVVFSTEKLDYLTVAIFAALISAATVVFTSDLPISLGDDTYDTYYAAIIAMIEFKPLVFIFGMQIVISVSEKQKIFQYIAIKTIRITKGNDRVLFYVICSITVIMAAVVADVTVAIIFAPLIIRTCRILEIKPAPYLFGMTICINIGSLITPFSSSENIIITDHFTSMGVNTLWFARNLMIFGLILLIVTMVLIDVILLKKEGRVDPLRKNLVQDVLVPTSVIEDNKKFILNLIFLIFVFISFFFTNQAFLVAIIGAILMILINKHKLSEYFKYVEWEVIFFFISLYIIIGCMIANGTIDIITSFLNKILPKNPLAIAIFVLILSSILSGFLANSPTALMFLVIMDGIFLLNDTLPLNPLIIALLIGINIGGNFLPQGAACDVMTLTIATRNKVEGFTFKTLTKYGALFASIHLLSGIIYLVFYFWIT